MSLVFEIVIQILGVLLNDRLKDFTVRKAGAEVFHLQAATSGNSSGPCLEPHVVAFETFVKIVEVALQFEAVGSRYTSSFAPYIIPIDQSSQSPLPCQAPE